MDVTKMPPPGAAVQPASVSASEAGSQRTANAAASADRADIRPLDTPAALQILLAEVRAAFELQAIAMGGTASEAVGSPPQAARALLQMVLGAMPDETADMPAWSAALARAETALQTGLDRGIDAVAVWRNVPPMVVDAAKEARTLVFSGLGDDPLNPAWLRPEWAGLGPRFERFWRRRRLARRHLTDPDSLPGSVDDGSEPRS
jgi:hypothetical protein